MPLEQVIDYASSDRDAESKRFDFLTEALFELGGEYRRSMWAHPILDLVTGPHRATCVPRLLDNARIFFDFGS
jgi:hypothetical protein